MRSLIISLALLLAQSLPSQVSVEPWLIRVFDIETNTPLSGISIHAPELDNADVPEVENTALTDANGEAVLQVPLGAVGLAVMAAGTNTHHYVVKNGNSDVPLTMFMAPYSAFHKSAIMPKTGTATSIVFNGTRPSPAGPINYQFLIDVPDGTLDAASQIWLYPRPLWAAGRSLNAACSPGEFHIELRDAAGNLAVRQRVNGKGLILRFTPFWLPGSEYPDPDQVIVDTRNLTTMEWDRDTTVGAWEPATNLVTLQLNHFSSQEAAYWNGLLRRLGFNTSYSTGKPKPPKQPAKPQPPQVPIPSWELVSYSKADCLTVAGVKTNGTIDCGTYQGGAASAGATQGGSVEAMAGFSTEASNKLNVQTSGLTKLLGKMEAETGFKFSTNAQGALTLTCGASAGKTWTQGNNLPSKFKCYSGQLWIFATERKLTMTAPLGLSVGINIPDTVVTYVCLDYQSTCAGCTPEPGPGMGAHIATSIPEGIKLCAGQAPCQ